MFGDIIWRWGSNEMNTERSAGSSASLWCFLLVWLQRGSCRQCLGHVCVTANRVRPRGRLRVGWLHILHCVLTPSVLSSPPLCAHWPPLRHKDVLCARMPTGGRTAEASLRLSLPPLLGQQGKTSKWTCCRSQHKHNLEAQLGDQKK